MEQASIQLEPTLRWCPLDRCRPHHSYLRGRPTVLPLEWTRRMSRFAILGKRPQKTPIFQDGKGRGDRIPTNRKPGNRAVATHTPAKWIFCVWCKL